MTIRRYTSHIAAQEAALALRCSGIIAAVVSDSDAIARIVGGAGVGAHAVVIEDASARVRARGVLAELEAHPVRADPEWEDTAAAPDLSLLDPSLPVPCPLCSYDLRALGGALGGEVICPECGGRVDFVRAILERHGPEALARCYPEPEDMISEEVVRSAALVCRRCQYPLGGLPAESHCPECGLAYSKRAMLRGP